MSKILVTGFEPFGLIGKFLRQTNSSQEIMAAIEEHYQGDV